MEISISELAEARDISLTGTPEEIVKVLDAMGIAHGLQVIKPEPVNGPWWRTSEEFKRALGNHDVAQHLVAIPDPNTQAFGVESNEPSSGKQEWEQITFDQIKPGMIVRHTWERTGVITSREGKVDRIEDYRSAGKMAVNSRGGSIASESYHNSTYYRLRKTKLSDDLWRTVRYEDIKSGDLIRILRPSGGKSTMMSPVDCMHSSGDWMTEGQGFIKYDPSFTYQRKES